MSGTLGTEERDLHERLQALRVDLPDGGFGARLHQRLVASGPPARSGRWEWLGARLGGRLLWPAIGIAAGVAAFLALELVRSAGIGTPAPAAATVEIAEVPASKIAVIRLNFSADVAVESADLKVSLPEGLAFWADGTALRQRSFEWTQPLQAGDNLIPIAVRGQRPGRYQVTATARIGGEQIEHDVVLEVVDG